MKWIAQFLTLTAICTLSVSGCSNTSSSNNEPYQTGLFVNNAIVVEGKTRTYDYYVPSGLSSSRRPLVFLLHGGGSKPDDLTGESGFISPYLVWMDIADREKFILVYPEGSINPRGELGWNDCRADTTNNPSLNDVDFIDALIDKMSHSFTIDSNRIYASGTSNGGHMVIRLALELSNKIAAIASVAAAMPGVACNSPSRPISVLFMNGTSDPLLPFEGGEVAPNIGGRGTVLSADESVNIWVRFNQTDSTSAITNFPDIDTEDSSTVHKATYSNGIEGTQVALYEITGGGHVEPSIREQYSSILELSLGKQNHDIEMADEIWKFFKDKTL